MLKWYYLYRVKLRKKKDFFFPFPCLETTPSLTVLSRLVLFIYLLAQSVLQLPQKLGLWVDTTMAQLRFTS